MLKRILPLVIVALITAPLLNWWPVSSANNGLPGRSLTIGSSYTSVTTDYRFQFDLSAIGNLGSIRFEFCSNDPLPNEPCTAPSGFDISSSVLSDQTGETGFIIDAGVTANDLLLTRPSAPQTLQTVSYTFNNVVNPDVFGTNYVRLYTFPTSDGTGVTLEDAGIAFAINEQFSITAYVPPYLQFCVGVTITDFDCSTATGNLIDFGILRSDEASVASSQMTGGTNGFGGLSIIATGSTMTSGINFIDALDNRSLSIPGINQFGINLRANNNPFIGSNPVGPGTTVPTANYNVQNQFYYVDGDTVATSPLSTDFTKLTVTYLVNTKDDQAPGVYTSTITFIATATF